MRLLKYSDVLALSKEKLAEAQAPFRAKEMKKRAELEQLQIESDIAKQDHAISEISSQYPIDFSKLIDAIDDLVVLERRKEQYGIIIKQLFDNDEPEPTKTKKAA